MDRITNFRDLGGYTNRDGLKVKKGMIYRSGELYKISEDDRNRLKNEIRLKTIVDFRSPQEIADKPDDVLKGVRYLHIDIMGDSKGKTSGFDDMINSGKSADETMLSIYDELLLTESSLHGFKQFIQLFLYEGNTPLVFHCFAGKDRTGLGAAFLLEILNVDRETIYEDYLKTNEYRREANEKEEKLLLDQGYSREDVDTAIEMLYVKSEYLDRAYELIDEKHKGMDNFISKVLGLSKEDIKKIQEAYLE